MCRLTVRKSLTVMVGRIFWVSGELDEFDKGHRVRNDPIRRDDLCIDIKLPKVRAASLRIICSTTSSRSIQCLEAEISVRATTNDNLSWSTREYGPSLFVSSATASSCSAERAEISSGPSDTIACSCWVRMTRPLDEVPTRSRKSIRYCRRKPIFRLNRSCSRSPRTTPRSR